MEKINGIILDGVVYTAVKGNCNDCDLKDFCGESDRTCLNDVCTYLEQFCDYRSVVFRQSQELTDKLNKI